MPFQSKTSVQPNLPQNPAPSQPPTQTSQPAPVSEPIGNGPKLRQDLTPKQPKKTFKKPGKALLLAIALFVVASLGILAYILFLTAKAPPKGPVLMVGSNRYVYACSVFD